MFVKNISAFPVYHVGVIAKRLLVVLGGARAGAVTRMLSVARVEL